jgi:acyl-coenzyme A thioesterase PaaI-like protein
MPVLPSFSSHRESPQSTMTATLEHFDAFAPLTWAAPYLGSPTWVVCDRDRGTEPGEDTDRFCRDTMRANNGVVHWLELWERPALGAKVTKSISFVKFGTGLNGFPGIAHGGALLTLMDEAMLCILSVNTVLETGLGFMKVGEESWRQQLLDGRPPQETLKGRFATARMDVKLLAPVLCPGVVGIETEVIEDRGHKMRMKATMKDQEGKPLLQAEGLWVRIGGPAKL